MLFLSVLKIYLDVMCNGPLTQFLNSIVGQEDIVTR